MTPITQALFITLVGMGLVFLAIFALWGLMALLVRLVQDPPEAEEAEETVGVAEDLALKQRAAAAAVAYALTQAETAQPAQLPLPATALVSAWQVANRSKTLNKRGPVR